MDEAALKGNNAAQFGDIACHLRIDLGKL